MPAPLRALGWALLCLALPAAALDQYTASAVERRPQPRDRFVQGLEFDGDTLYVSTGTYGGSRLLRLRFEDGTVLDERRLAANVFAEGLTVLRDAVFQLTWRNRLLLEYDRDELALRRALPLPGEGWGLTNDGEHLIYSDGSEHLYYLDPADGRRVRTVRVTERGRALRALNELEWVEGRIWANVWGTDRIVVIDPDSGAVTASIDLAGLLPAGERRPDTDVLNGIAREPGSGAIWVTGKRWPWLYRIELRPADP